MSKTSHSLYLNLEPLVGRHIMKQKLSAPYGKMKQLIHVKLLKLTQSLKSNFPILFRRLGEFDMSKSYAVRAEGYDSNDTALIFRIIASYQLAKKEHLGNSMWQLFFDYKHKNIHDVFIQGDFNSCAPILRNPKNNDLFYGFDNLCASIDPKSLIAHDHLNLDLLIRFGEAISAIRLDRPESYFYMPKRKWNLSEILDKIENKLGIQISFPNPHEGEIGVQTPRGIASYRAICALYQAYLIKDSVKGIKNPRVLEIGAGLGRTAYFSHCLASRTTP